jgi:hypothetical protein
MKYEDFELTEEQLKAINSIKRAVAKATKCGVAIFAKSDTLHAYSQKAWDKDLVCPLHETHNFDYEHPVQNEIICHINDSGADDMEYFKKGIF